MIPAVAVLASVIDFAGSVLIAGYVAAACLQLVLRRIGADGARLLVAQGSLAGLGLKLAATLLKTIVLQSWADIASFAAIAGLRMLMKATLAAERRRLGG